MGERVQVGKALIGAVLLEAHRVLGMAVDRGLRSGHFVDAKEGRVWDVLVETFGARGVLDLVVAQEAVEREGIELDGGVGDWLIECVDVCVTATHAEAYVEGVLEQGLRRDLARVGSDLIGDVQRDQDVRGVGERAAARVMEVLDGACGDEVGESNEEAAARIAEAYCSGEMGRRSIGIEWPWEHATQVTCGLEQGMIVLAGRPSAGKTSIEDSLCVEVAAGGLPVGRVTLDSTRNELLQRAMSRMAEVSLPKLKFGYAREDERVAFTEAGELVGRLPMHFEDRRRDLPGILARAREWKRKYDIGLLTVDFMQLISTGDPRIDVNQVARVGIVSAALKGLALELGIPVLALSQLSRASAQDSREPQLHDLRGSGDIEQDAHQVVFVHVDTACRKAMEEEHPGWTKKVRPVWFDVLKNKDGECARVPLVMYPSYFKFEEPQENVGTDNVMGFDTLMELGLMPKVPGEG